MTKESFDKLLSLLDDHPVFPNTSFKSHYIIMEVEQWGHECEQQFNLVLEKEQFICMFIELPTPFLHYKESIYIGQNLTHWSTRRLLDDINRSMASQTA